MPTTSYFGITYVTPFDPAYTDLWGTPLNDAIIEFDRISGRLQCTGDVRYPEAADYRIVTNTRFPFTVDSATLETDAGTLTAAVKINSTAVTGLSAVAVTSTEAQTNATAANTASIGDNLLLTLSSVSGVSSLRYNIWLDRTAAGTA